MQRAELALKLKDAIAEEAKARQVATLKRGDKKPDVQKSAPREKSKTRDKIADLAGVSHDTIRRVEKIVAEAAPAVVEATRKGESSIHAPHAVRHARRHAGARDASPARERTHACMNAPRGRRDATGGERERNAANVWPTVHVHHRIDADGPRMTHGANGRPRRHCDGRGVSTPHALHLSRRAPHALTRTQTGAQAHARMDARTRAPAHANATQAIGAAFRAKCADPPCARTPIMVSYSHVHGEEVMSRTEKRTQRQHGNTKHFPPLVSACAPVAHSLPDTGGGFYGGNEP